MITQGIFLFVLTLIAKIAGFARDLVLSYFYGASNIVDAYVIATTIPMVIFSFVGTGIQTSLIPMLNKVDKQGKDKNSFLSNVINIFVLACVLAIFIVFVFTEQVVTLFASGFNQDTMIIAVSFTRYSIIGIIFSTLTYIYTGTLQYKNKFIAAAFSTILMDIIVLIFVALSSSMGLYLLPIGNVVALIVQTLFLKLFIHHKHKFIVDLKEDNFKLMLTTIIPIIIGTSVNQINLLVDQSIASNMMSGGIAYLNYANKVLGVVQGVFILTFISFIFPKMSHMVISGKIKKLSDKIKGWFIFLEFFIIPCTIIFCFYSFDIIKLLFYRGNFTLLDVEKTSLILFIYSIQLPFYTLRELIVRVYYAGGNTKLPLVNSVIGLVIHLLLAIILSNIIGIAALPLATTISCTFTAVYITKSYLYDYGFRDKLVFIKTIISSNACFIVLYALIIFILKNFIFPADDLNFMILIFQIIFSFIIYLIIIFVILILKPEFRKYMRL